MGNTKLIAVLLDFDVNEMFVKVNFWTSLCSWIIKLQPISNVQSFEMLGCNQ